MKLFIVASNTSRTAIVIAASKPEALKVAKKERKMIEPTAHEIIDYFWDNFKEYEETGKATVWAWTGETENNNE